MTSYLMPTYFPPEVTFSSGSGVRLVDSTGKQYLDFLAGLAVVSLGHSHPGIAKALSEQSQELLHTSNLYGNEHNEDLAKELDGLLGGGGQVFFANSGAEANEAAIKLARKFGGHNKFAIIGAYGSFHGRTLATLAATGQPQKHEPFVPMPEGFSFVEFGNIDALASQVTQQTAAVFLEPILGEGGVLPAPAGYLQEVREVCSERGVLLMMDEIQTGLGRTGNWFGHQLEDIKPDVVTMAKALGNGFPIGACWAKKEVAQAFEPGDHASTFGGQALACRVAKEVIQTLKAINAPRMAKEMGGYLAEKLHHVHGIKEVRGRGLMLAAELDDEYHTRNITAKDITSWCLEEGLIVNAVTPTSIRWTPPLIVEKSDIDEALEIFASVLHSSLNSAPKDAKK